MELFDGLPITLAYVHLECFILLDNKHTYFNIHTLSEKKWRGHSPNYWSWFYQI